jgi:hypothetical protein
MPPRTIELTAQYLEARKFCQQGPARLAKPLEGIVPSGAPADESSLCASSSACRFRGGGGIVDHVGISKPTIFLQAGRSQPGKFRYRLHVDAERIEKETAVREVRAWLRRPIIEQSMRRLRPTPEAPRSAARSMSARRSVKSP